METKAKKFLYKRQMGGFFQRVLLRVVRTAGKVLVVTPVRLLSDEETSDFLVWLEADPLYPQSARYPLRGGGYVARWEA